MLGDEPGPPGPAAAGRTRPSTGIRPDGCLVEVVTPSSRQEELPVNALLVSFAVIFVAEMGDKSQLMALTFATRYRAVPILIGIAIATASVHAVSVLVGAVLAVSLPTDVINIVAGLAFLGFAAWTIRGDRLSEDEAAKVERQSNRSAIAAASGAFFLAELGDKTMLATITLASTHNPWWVWLGSTIGMVFADALGDPRRPPPREAPARTRHHHLRRGDVRVLRGGADPRGRRRALTATARPCVPWCSWG